MTTLMRVPRVILDGKVVGLDNAPHLEGVLVGVVKDTLIATAVIIDLLCHLNVAAHRSAARNGDVPSDIALAGGHALLIILGTIGLPGAGSLTNDDSKHRDTSRNNGNSRFRIAPAPARKVSNSTQKRMTRSTNQDTVGTDQRSTPSAAKIVSQQCRLDKKLLCSGYSPKSSDNMFGILLTFTMPVIPALEENVSYHISSKSEPAIFTHKIPIDMATPTPNFSFLRI